MNMGLLGSKMFKHTWRPVIQTAHIQVWSLPEVSFRRHRLLQEACNACHRAAQQVAKDTFQL